MLDNIFSVEMVDWSSDSIWDAWLWSINSSKDAVDDRLEVFKKYSIERFRVLEVEMDTNKVIDGWMVLAGDGKIEWQELAYDDMRFQGRTKK